MSKLRTHDLVVEYTSGGNTIRPIDGLNLELEAGSLTILLGPSGCGKTTLLSCLGGLLTPTSGRITIGELDVTATVPHDQLDMIKATLGAEYHSYPYLGVYYLGLNLTRPPFQDNFKLREALTLAVDRELLVSKLAETTYVQRLNTDGGLPPSPECTAEGARLLAPYSADYVFYEKAHGHQNRGD